MSNLEDKLLELKELLEKGMKNSGLGGVGSVKAGAVLPSISKMPKPGNASQAGAVGIPGQASASKVNPIKSAEQTHNKDIKDIKMKEAHAQLAMKKGEGEDLYHIHENGVKITSTPMTLKDIHEKHGGVKKLESSGFRVIQHKPEEVKIAKNGQWSLDDMEKSEKAPEFDGEYHGQTHVKSTERGHRVVRFPGKDPHTGEAKTYAKKVPNKIHITHKWDHNNKKWEHISTKDHLAEHTHSAPKSLNEHAHEKAQAYEAEKNKPKVEVKPKTIRRSADIKKSLDELVDELEKSGYKGYTPEDNARRKANNIGETTGIHTMNSVKAYGGSGPSAADREAKEMRAKSKKNPVKVYTPEEIAEMNKEESRPFYEYKADKGVHAHLNDAKNHVKNKDIKNARASLEWAKQAAGKSPVSDTDKTRTLTDVTEKTEKRTTAVPGVSDMGIEVRRSNPKDTSYSKVVSPEKHGETAKEIARTNIKETSSIKPKLPK
jgi:hypothetical protein